MESNWISAGQPSHAQGAPDNPFIESFNGKLRAECLNQHWFESIQEARNIIENWRKEYNQERPHSSLGDLTPLEFEENWQGQKALKK